PQFSPLSLHDALPISRSWGPASRVAGRAESDEGSGRSVSGFSMEDTVTQRVCSRAIAASCGRFAVASTAASTNARTNRYISSNGRPNWRLPDHDHLASVLLCPIGRPAFRDPALPEMYAPQHTVQTGGRGRSGRRHRFTTPAGADQFQ